MKYAVMTGYKSDSTFWIISKHPTFETATAALEVMVKERNKAREAGQKLQPLIHLRAGPLEEYSFTQEQDLSFYYREDEYEAINER